MPATTPTAAYYYIEGGQQFNTGAPAGNTSVPPGIYRARAWRVTCTGPSYKADPKVLALGYWGLNGSINSASSVPFTFYGPPTTGVSNLPRSTNTAINTTQLVTAEPGVEVAPGSAGKRGLLVEGYVYELLAYYPLVRRTAGYFGPYSVSPTPTAPAQSWIPFNPLSNPSGSVRVMNYSVWTLDLMEAAPFRSSPSGNADKAIPTRSGAYPNPANEQVTLLFAAEADEQVTAELSTVDGKTVRVVQQVSKPAGALHTVKVSLAGLPTGLYFYRIVSKKAVQQGRFTKAD